MQPPGGLPHVLHRSTCRAPQPGRATMKLDGNTILITGGASGIGLALAADLQKRGNTVIITGRDKAKLDKAKQEIPGLHVVQSDVARPAEIDALFAKLTQEFP